MALRSFICLAALLFIAQLCCHAQPAALKAKVETKNACHVIAEKYEALGDYRSALPYWKRYANLSDSFFNDQMQHSTALLEAKFEYEKKVARLREEQNKKDLLNASIVQTRQLEIWLSVTVIILLSLLSHLLCRSRTAKQRSNRELMAMHDKMTRQKEEIERHSSRLLVNNQQKDKLFSIISHDLKMPLQSLHTMLDLLKAQALSEAEISEMIETLRQEVDYSSELIRNLLLWSNSQLNGIVAKPVDLNLQQLADEVSAQFKNQAAQKEVALCNRLSPALQAHADKDMLHAVLRNLLSNAIKFCVAGDTITLEGRAAGGQIEIGVTDTGTGIPEDILDKINRHQTVTTTGTAGEKGTGLGLLLCRDFIELNKGDFRAESIRGLGSRFYITLPQSPAIL